jgi:hypothetical protein
MLIRAGFGVRERYPRVSPGDRKLHRKFALAPAAEEDVSMPQDDLPQQPDETLAVLRGIWTARRQQAADVRPGSGKVCRNMKNIGFGADDGGSTAGPVDEEQRVAWRERLAREGKVAPGSTTLRDLLLGDGS